MTTNPLEIEMSFYEDAVKFRELSRVLYQQIAKTNCTCEETVEYQQYRAYTLTMTPKERVRYVMLVPFEGETLAKECDRCIAIGAYVTAIGDEAHEYEVDSRIDHEEVRRKWRKMWQEVFGDDDDDE